ncbi:MAG: hypothetical protein OXG83_15570 [Acidobacteria bacterium]|nr:hypothetical protein [Acidobacteriota bacterium]
MTSAFVASGPAGTSYRTLFRKQILRVRPRVVGMAVAYVSASGFSLVKKILDEGDVGEVRLVTDTKDGVTHPKALRSALENGWETRIVHNPGGTFHPKLYVGATRFDDEAGLADVSLAITGSPNISHGGFLSNCECAFWSSAPRHRRSAARAWHECWNAGEEATESRIQTYEEYFARRNRDRSLHDLVTLGIVDNVPSSTNGAPPKNARRPSSEDRAISETVASVAWAGLETFTGEHTLQVEFPREAGQVLRRILEDFLDHDSVAISCTDGDRYEFIYRYYRSNGMYRLNVPNTAPHVDWARKHKRGLAYVERRGTPEGLHFAIVPPGQAMDEIVGRSLMLGTWGRTPTRLYGWY